MKILVDTNILLDVSLNREPFVYDSSQVVDFAVRSLMEGYLCATTVTTYDYLLQTELPREAAKRELRKLMNIFEIAPVNRMVLESALESRITDFEDAVLEQSALLCGVDLIVTRNLKDFKHSAVPAVAPREVISTILG